MKMQTQALVVASLAAAAALSEPGSASARGYRYTEAVSCAPAPSSIYFYPAPNWDPFFRRPDYVARIYTNCGPVAERSNTVISVRY
jgi:hypothetical protein